MRRLVLIAAALLAVLFVAPVLEGYCYPWTSLFQAVGTAAEGAGD